MLRATHDKTNELYLSFDRYRDIVKIKDEFICPECREKVIFVDSKIKIKHFRHKVASDCSFEQETIEHEEMKKYVQELLKLDESAIEFPLGFAKPDIFIKELNIAIEVQYSNIPLEKFLIRTNNYTKNNIYVIWIFHHALLDINKNLARPSAMLREAHKLYFGRVYIYNEDGIYPVHFNGVSRYIEPTNFGGGYWKYYKQIKEIRFGSKIEEFEFNFLKTTNSSNILIARFYDKVFWKND